MASRRARPQVARSARRTRLPGIALLAAGSAAFAGYAASCFATGRATRSTGLLRRPAEAVAGGARTLRPASMRDSEGNKVRDPKTFNAGDPSQVESTIAAEYKKRPFGVLAYAPSTDGKGAMVLKMNEKSRYPGDPQGQAWVGGVRAGYAIKAVAGQDVSNWDFWDIMDIIDDKILDNSAGKFQHDSQGSMGNSPAALPLSIEYAQLKLAAGEAPPPPDTSGTYINRDDPRYADLPPDAKLVEYKIPPAPASYTSPTVEGLRGYAMSLPEPAGYAGPRYNGPGSVNPGFIDQMLANFKQGQLLPMKDAYRMALDVFDLLVKEKTLGRVMVPEGKKVTVVGDLHGQLYDFSHMLSLAGYPSPDNQFVFNGDFVDRGRHQLELVGLLLALKVRYPEKVWLIRGNHEDKLMNEKYGFKSECLRLLGNDFGKKMFNLMQSAFDRLPLACLVANRALILHGGIGDGMWGLSDIWTVARPLSSETLLSKDNSWLFNILWSDPIEDGVNADPNTFGVHASPRGGVTAQFAWNITKTFCARNGLGLIIRSHQSKKGSRGFDVMHSNMLVRVFSARDYEGHGNDGAVLMITKKTGEADGEGYDESSGMKDLLVVRPQVLRSVMKQRAEAARYADEATTPPPPRRRKSTASKEKASTGSGDS